MGNTTVVSSERGRTLLWRIRAVMAFFIVALVASGLTAIPVEAELNAVASVLGLPPQANPQDYSGLPHWIARIREGIRDTNARHPFIAYGFDWLAFAHVVLGILFIGPLRDPVRNRWVITFGMIACVLVVPWAFIFTPIRGLPRFWALIDSAFGVFGVIPLWLCRRWAIELGTLGAA